MRSTKKAQLGQLLEWSYYEAEEVLQNRMVDNISPTELNNTFITHIGNEIVLGVRLI
jgi:hypothetical protein